MNEEIEISITINLEFICVSVVEKLLEELVIRVDPTPIEFGKLRYILHEYKV